MKRNILVLLLFCSITAFCQEKDDGIWNYNPPLNYIAYKTETPLKIDGKADEASWKSAEWTQDFVDIEGSKKPAPEYRTRVKILWDDDYFYFFAELQEPDVSGNITERDAVIFHDNDFEIFIKPYTEFPQYGELEINALGTVWDLLLMNAYREGGPVLNNWDIKGLKTAVRVEGTLNDPSDTDRGWSVEIAVPRKALQELKFKSPDSEIPQMWRINFSRVEWNYSKSNGKYEKKRDARGKLLPEQNWVWSPQGAIDMHRPEFWGYVKFSDKKPGTDKFISDPDEGIIMALFHLYKQEKKYFSQNGSYTKDIRVLEPLKFIFGKDEYKPEIKMTNFGYEIVFDQPQERQRCVINEKGIVKKIRY